MAKSKVGARKSRAKKGGTRRPAGRDAIDFLKADHRQVEDWFDEFESTGSDTRKQDLAHKICQALLVHTEIEAEIFYPAFLEHTDEREIHHEAEVEHAGAKKLIAQIEESGPEDDYFDAKIKVLSEMIKHHVNEEEKRGGMFAKARQSDMDLDALGEQLQARKSELMEEEPRRNGTGSRRGAGKETGRQGGLFTRMATR
ncbi:MAG TPA: hemerythrin domain-containing protein [Steroidobacteraceae bacterium]|nr:hemerythrin domain-containing protein [Steroidobacteraceae bacterium]